MADSDPSMILATLRGDPVIGRLVGELRAEPPGQARIFRTRLLASGAPCILKLADELEAIWMPAISARASDIVAEVLAHGVLTELERPWLLLADLPHRGRSDRHDIARDVMRAAARFQQEATELELATYPIDADFMITYAQQAIDAGCPGPASDVLARIGTDEDWLRSLGGHLKGHGDVHFWNALAPTPDGPWRLIDPIPRTAHWAWDAGYAQLTSGLPETPDLIMLLTQERQRLGLPVPGIEQFDRLRTVILGWSALLWWAILPARREESWWRAEVERNVTALAVDLRTR
ncbi:hypothetical protein [Microlunatus sp. GCM10028923]|uniref:hypothetical protein n=1 Tax=Microlunatus sp. GCM10028923 TaxID=3273400 RepID=UPI00361B68A0